MTTFESTVSMLEMLPEADLMVINSMARRLLARSIEGNPYQPLSQQEWEAKLDKSMHTGTVLLCSTECIRGQRGQTQ